MTCLACVLIHWFWRVVPKDNVNYWRMTELFVKLHRNHDYCEEC